MTTQSNKLHIKRFRCKLLGNVESLEVDEAGQLVRFEGPNKSGKTTSSEALRALFGGGNNVELIQNGAEEGEAYALLSNSMEVMKTLSRDGFKLTVRDAETGKGVDGGEQTWLNAHLDTMLASNPADVLRAEPDKRGQLLLESIPKYVSLDELRETIGGAVELTGDIDAEGLGETVEYVDTSQHALQAMAQLHKRIYARRRDINRDAKKKDGAIQEARDSLPEDLDSIETAEEVRARRDGFKEQLEAVKAEANEAGKQLAEEARAKSSAVDEEFDAKVSEIDAATEAADAEIEQLEKRIEQLKSDNKLRESHKESLEKERRGQKAEINAEFQQAKAEAMQQYTPRISELEGEIKSADSAIEHAAERSNTLKTLRQRKAEKDELDAQSEQLTAALQSLDELKASLLADLPIDGIEIGEDGNIYSSEGVPFEQMSTAEQVDVACLVVARRDGGIVFLDRVESLDSKTFWAIVKRLNEMGFQVWTFEVAETDDLRVITGEDAYNVPRPREAAAAEVAHG